MTDLFFLAERDENIGALICIIVSNIISICIAINGKCAFFADIRNSFKQEIEMYR